MQSLSQSFFADDAVVVAQKLLGKIISFNGCSGRIVETEAYTTDEASHGFRLTPRSQIMKDTYGHIYIYLIYGMYYCLNFTTNKGSVGAVLIRAVEPLQGVEVMKQRRKTVQVANLCKGPGKLCQAFDITKDINGVRIGNEFKIYDSSLSFEMGVSIRKGITKETELLWRFFIKNNAFVS